MIGYWETEAPLTPAQVREDQLILASLANAIPVKVAVRRWEVYVNGRLYRWTTVDTTTIGGQWR